MKSKKSAWILYNKLPYELKHYVLNIYLEKERRKNTETINSIIELAGDYFENFKTSLICGHEITDNSFIHFLNSFNKNYNGIIYTDENQYIHPIFNKDFKWKWQILNNKVYWAKMCRSSLKFFFGRRSLEC